MIDTNSVILEKRGQALWITINRPEKRNAINGDVIAVIADGYRAAHDDRDVRVSTFGNLVLHVHLIDGDVPVVRSRAQESGRISGERVRIDGPAANEETALLLDKQRVSRRHARRGQSE